MGKTFRGKNKKEEIKRQKRKKDEKHIYNRDWDRANSYDYRDKRV